MDPFAGPETCDGPVVSSHTIQRSGGLTRIARSGHVYAFKPDLGLLKKHDGLLTPILVGVGNASTFPGFCGRHDKEMFRPIEDHPFDESNPEHVFLVCYRAICQELHAKRGVLQHLTSMRNLDKGKPFSHQVQFQQWLARYTAGTLAGLRDAEHLKGAMDDIAQSHDFSTLNYVAVSLDGEPPFLCCGATAITHDFHGRVLRSLSDDLDRTADAVVFAVVPTDAGWAAVFCWLSSGSEGRAFGESLAQLNDEDWPGAIGRFTFEHFENTCIAPEWWESLSDVSRLALLDRLRRCVSPIIPRRDDCLVDDGVRCVPGTVTAVRVNVK